jgi:aminoglycoside/choline kinase family phosphotransferase
MIIIGILARLSHRAGKPRYHAEVARVVGYLDTVLPRYPELAPLGALLERHVKPALVANPFKIPV